jgi:nitrogenase molybdenum-iron protein alpha chain
MPAEIDRRVVKGKDNRIPVCYTETKPGDFTERGCSFLGCRVVICGQIKNVIHIVHSPIGCAYYSWDYRADSKGYCFTTDLQEMDIVFGGEKKLLDAIVMAVREFDPDAVFVYETCSTGLIGDDIQSVAEKASEITGKPVIAFECAGFRGISQNYGHKIANIELFKLIARSEDAEPIPNGVNVIGDFNSKDAEAIEGMLKRLGIEVICTFTANATIDRIKAMRRARLNLVQCSRSSIFLAELMKERFGIPFIEVNFFGIQNCCESLRRIAEFFDTHASIIERAIEKNLRRVLPKVEHYREKLRGKKVFICHGAQRSLYWIKPFEELGMEIVGVATYFGRKEDYRKIARSVKDGTVIVDNPSADELEEILLELKPDLVISDDRIKPYVYKLGIPFINGRGQGRAYAGFDGFVTFAKDIYETLSARIWRIATRGVFHSG